MGPHWRSLLLLIVLVACSCGLALWVSAGSSLGEPSEPLTVLPGPSAASVTDEPNLLEPASDWGMEAVQRDEGREAVVSLASRDESFGATPPEGKVLVRFVDGRSQPVPSVPVAAAGTWLGGFDHEWITNFGLTDERGEVLIHDPGFRFEGDGPGALAVALPLATPVWGEVPPEKRLQLTIPDTEQLGVVEVAMLGMGDDPRKQAGTLYFEYGFNEAHPGLTLLSSKFRFPLRLAVPLGIDYTLGAWLAEWKRVRPDDKRNFGQRFPPLSQSLSARSHEIIPGVRKRVLVGRLLQPGGAPSPVVKAFAERGGERHKLERSYTDARGNFRFVLGSLETWDRVRFIGGAHEQLEYVMPIPGRFSGLDHELGDIVLSPRPVLVAGRIDGEAWQPWFPAEALQAMDQRVVKFSIYERRGPGDPWCELERDWHFDLESRGYRVFGEPGVWGAEHRVYVKGFNCRQISCGAFASGTRGAQDLVVEMGASATLRLDLTLPDGVARHDLDLRLEYEACCGAPPGAEAVTLDKRSAGLHPGTALVIVERSGSEIWRSTPIELPPGTTKRIAVDLSYAAR